MTRPDRVGNQLEARVVGAVRQDSGSEDSAINAHLQLLQESCFGGLSRCSTD